MEMDAIPPPRRPEGGLPPAARTGRAVVVVCQGPSCSERGGTRLLAVLRARAAEIPGPVAPVICAAACLDSCATGPNALVAGEQDLCTGVLGEAALRLADAVAGPRPAAHDATRP